MMLAPFPYFGGNYPSERWLCSCGEDITPSALDPEGRLFHWLADHKIAVLPVGDGVQSFVFEAVSM